MQSKVSSTWSLVAISLVGILFSSTIIAGSTPVEPIQNIYSVGETTLGFPVRLTIPKLNVDASIEDVGLTADGAMAVPAGPVDVAWYDLGPRPGDAGSAVIAGHEGWKDGIAAVFDDLHELAVGDKIYVEDATGTPMTFIVNKIEAYGENDAASSVFDSSDGLAHLNLITCEGIWNAKTQSYSGRLVVFADKEME